MNKILNKSCKETKYFHPSKSVANLIHLLDKNILRTK